MVITCYALTFGSRNTALLPSMLRRHRMFTLDHVVGVAPSTLSLTSYVHPGPCGSRSLEANCRNTCGRAYLNIAQVVHLIGQGPLEDDDKAPFQVVSGGGSDLARVNCSLRHDTAYKPHEVRMCCV